MTPFPSPPNQSQQIHCLSLVLKEVSSWLKGFFLAPVTKCLLTGDRLTVLVFCIIVESLPCNMNHLEMTFVVIW